MRKCISCDLEKECDEYRGNRKKCKKCENKRKKPKYEFICVVCKNVYYSTKQNEKRKKFVSTCASCAINQSWKDEEYRKNHILALKQAHNREEVRARHGVVSKKRFENEDYKKKALQRLNTEQARNKAARSIRETWKDPEKSRKMLTAMYKTRSQNVECSKGILQVKSGYEKRFIKILDKHFLEWEYEPSSFKLENLNKLYIPDFYIKDLDLWIEVKGYWYKDAKEKWDCFLLEYPHLKKIVINKQTLCEIEKGLKIEDLVNRKE